MDLGKGAYSGVHHFHYHRIVGMTFGKTKHTKLGRMRKRPAIVTPEVFRKFPNRPKQDPAYVSAQTLDGIVRIRCHMVMWLVLLFWAVWD